MRIRNLGFIFSK